MPSQKKLQAGLFCQKRVFEMNDKTEGKEELGQKIKELQEELDAYKTRAHAYAKVIEKYADFINAGERKTVPQLKELVKPSDSAVQKEKEKLALRLREEKILAAKAEGKMLETWEEEYNFPRDFISAARLCLELMKSLKPIHANLSASYWFSPKEMVELQAADPLDKAVFFCSLLRAFECPNARVRVVKLSDGRDHPVVLFEFDGKSFAVEACDEKAQIEGRENETFESRLSAMKIDGQKYDYSRYEFNDLEYEEFEE